MYAILIEENILRDHCGMCFNVEMKASQLNATTRFRLLDNPSSFVGNITVDTRRPASSLLLVSRTESCKDISFTIMSRLDSKVRNKSSIIISSCSYELLFILL